MAKKLTVDDLLNLEGNKVPNDARSYSTFIYSEPKEGKTTLVNDMYGERVLFLASEKRHAHIPNAHVININSYADYLRAMKLLKDDKLKEKYDALCIDTLGRMESFVEAMVLSKLDIDNLKDLPYGAGYAEYNKELENMISLIEHSGYIPVFIAHAKETTERVEVEKASDEVKESESAQRVTENGKQYIEYKRVVPDVKNKLWNIVNRVADQILYLGNVVDENGVEHRKIFYRNTPDHLAGSSFKYMPESTELSADAYLKAVEDAISKEGSDNTKDGGREQSKGVDYDFDSLMTEAGELGQKLQKEGRTKELSQVVEDVLGKGKKVKDLKSDQAEVLSVFVDKLKDLV